MNEVYTDLEKQPFKQVVDEVGIKDPTKLLKLVPNNPRYFTPSLEDIRVGYECEWLQDPAFEKWIPFTVALSNIGLLLKNDQSGLNFGIRVPYLSKEQIEAEGWVKQDNNFNETQRLAWIPDYELKTDFGSLRLYISNKDKPWENITIEKYTKSDVNDAFSMSSKWVVYRGQCKDINTFRYICKLLNI
jgi:hypothetical protein